MRINLHLKWHGYLFALLIVFFSHASFALEQHSKLWLATGTQQAISTDKEWLIWLYSQLRWIDENHPLQSTLIEGAFGYQFPDLSVWLGYRWTGHDPDQHFIQENRLFQQIIWQKRLIDLSQIIFRGRFEQIQRSHSNQIALRLRPRLAIEIHHSPFAKIFPYLYNEVFVQLNHTDFTPHSFIGENRLFIGFNWHYSKKAVWEIGYINQYHLRTPQQTQNQMNHILSITYNFS